MLSFKEQGIESGELAPRWKVGMDRRQVALYVGIALVAGFMFGFVTARYTTRKDAAVTAPISTTEASTSSAPAVALNRVTRILRADTVEVEGTGQVRMIGVESPDGKSPQEIYGAPGKNALEFTEKSLLGREVRLEFDPALGNKDETGQTIAYIYLPDGSLFNAELVKQGHAFVRSNERFRLAEDFRNFEREASLAMRGLWGSNGSTGLTASGQTSSGQPLTPGQGSSTQGDKSKRLAPMPPSELGPNVPALSSGAPSTGASSSEATVLVSSADRMYHKSGCEYLSKKREPMALSQARSQGFTACGRCFASTVLKAQ